VEHTRSEEENAVARGKTRQHGEGGAHWSRACSLQSKRLEFKTYLSFPSCVSVDKLLNLSESLFTQVIYEV
jgi:hypothetical protein